MRHHTIQLKPLQTLQAILVGAVLAALSPQASAISSGLRALQELIKMQNDKGYGKTISTALTKLTILNKTGLNGDSRTLKVRTLNKVGRWSQDTQLPPGSSLSYSMWDTQQVSLNGDGASDDIKVNNTKGYIEYQSAKLNDQNLWPNLVTWNGESQRWLMTSLFDKIDGDKTVLLPSIDTARNELTITLIDGHNYGTTITNFFQHLRLKNSTQSFTFDISYQDEEGDWHNDRDLEPGSSTSWYQIDKTQQISLNGGGNNDDLKINNDEGYIEFNIRKATGSVAGITVKDDRVWVTQAWYHPVIKQWFGQGTWSNIDNKGDLPSVTLTPQFNIGEKDITFELKDKVFIPPK